MSAHKFKFQMYRSLQQNIPNIYADARKAADEINIPKELRGKFGLTGAISGCPAPLRDDIMEFSEHGAKEVIPLAKLVDEIRELVKSVYGDEYDACPVTTCEAGLWVTFDSLFSPPMMGRGDNYRARYIAPYEKHLHHQGSYGRPFPARYKDVLADRGSTAGELGFYGKRQNNLDTIIVPLAGARYDVHGIKYHPVPLLTDVDPDESLDILTEHASIHAPFLTGITSLGYETPGYGYAVKDEEGTPILQKYLADLAHSYDIPYVIDNAWGLPFVGCNPLKNGADVIIYSMDKATGSATSGLIIGKEEFLVPIRRAMGVHGDRYGTTASYGKAAYVAFDPGKEALLTQIQALKVLRDNPKVLTKPVDVLENIIKEEFANINLPAHLKDGILISKSYNSTAVEINYEKTWSNGELGIPIFSIEDMYAGSNIFQTGMAQMGVIPTVAYDGNIYVSTGLATTDNKGRLLEDVTRYAIKALVRLIEITCKYAGIA
ncbi:PLP-dependent transferase [Sporomusa acidovorans]|uniref:Methionine gamma-lyase n=1 Tax=Sporomusa acidovorans (strain ATCC 49682 / DSM 3132 / Mol) TaxID=1123286 RepID=A0ABZ3J364_SPOA4|nr:PLP-dependent transferase [Sporomusa acidovorans]OZC20292.1 O-acetylhomoserine aminocarboxypropyltransferase [Sporomusa acidovorans DSM 3132]SDD39017.1 Cys/Met metabolism PLP-dependent enzyme [Sporomusa acidovorans]